MGKTRCCIGFWTVETDIHPRYESSDAEGGEEGEEEDEDDDEEAEAASQASDAEIVEQGKFQSSHLVPPVLVTNYKSVPSGKKRKLDNSADSPAKKTKTAENGDDEEDAEEEGDVEDDADEEEQEEDEPAVKTKVIKGSEAKAGADEAEDEELEAEA